MSDFSHFGAKIQNTFQFSRQKSKLECVGMILAILAQKFKYFQSSRQKSTLECVGVILAFLARKFKNLK